MKQKLRSILEVLSEHPEGLSPERVFALAGFAEGEFMDGTSPIDAFYAELKQVRKKLVEEKPSGHEAKRWPSNSQVILKAKT